MRGYVRPGRLKAKRIGQQYRVTRESLEEFAGTSAIDAPVPRTRHVIASTIIDADAISPPVAERISTMVMAGLNAKRDVGDVADFVRRARRARAAAPSATTVAVSSIA